MTDVKAILEVIDGAIAPPMTQHAAIELLMQLAEEIESRAEAIREDLRREGKW